MGLSGFTMEITSSVSAVRMFNAAVLDGHKLAPKLMPALVVSSLILEGDGGVGTIKQINFTEASQFSFIKERVDVLNKEHLEYKVTVIEGGHIGKKVEWVTNHIKVDSTDNGGCVYKLCCEYKTLSGIEYTEEEVHRAKNGIIVMVKAIEAYLVENPDC
ncbi:hypothetical protein AQUCO_00300629v1 [Aquilegia coerulea]|uniref:Bet v I/Major latex protein domain-containing protein n=1 Tax=Aquilegia coerulea TaxID=218851 RepID=A0A2G5EZT2_AQUCA|nr:hypothetical protein AQUCO_00300629v1 [Aquilegia coerulea]